MRERCDKVSDKGCDKVSKGGVWCARRGGRQRLRVWRSGRSSGWLADRFFRSGRGSGRAFPFAGGRVLAGARPWWRIDRRRGEVERLSSTSQSWKEGQR